MDVSNESMMNEFNKIVIFVLIMMQFVKWWMNIDAFEQSRAQNMDVPNNAIYPKQTSVSTPTCFITYQDSIQKHYKVDIHAPLGKSRMKFN